MIVRMVLGRGNKRRTFEGVNGRNERAREDVKNFISRPQLFRAMHTL